MIKNPNNKKKIPILLNLAGGIPSIVLSIFFILVGKMAKNNPSINKSNPSAVNRSLMKIN
jgi:preprotein translocase subunit SecY